MVDIIDGHKIGSQVEKSVMKEIQVMSCELMNETLSSMNYIIKCSTIDSQVVIQQFIMAPNQLPIHQYVAGPDRDVNRLGECRSQVRHTALQTG